MRVSAICNPVAGGGRAGRQWPQIETLLQNRFVSVTTHQTRGPGDAATIAAELARTGTGLLIVCGGDGTISEVVDGLLRARAFEGAGAPKLGIIPDGTGSDLSRTLGLTRDIEAQIDRIATGNFRRIDAGRMTFLSDKGEAAVRHFINVASLGLSGPTDRAVNAARAKRRHGAKAVFLYNTVRELLRYRFDDVRISVDGGAPIEARIALVAVANGRYFGGGMLIAPDAAIDDGLFEIAIVRGSGKAALIRQIPKLYSGTHVRLPIVTMLKGRRIVLEPADGARPALVDIDGESPGRIPATFEILPGALEVAL